MKPWIQTLAEMIRRGKRTLSPLHRQPHSSWPMASIDGDAVDPDLKDMPDDHQLERWAASEWAEYQAWLFHHDTISCQDWREMRRISTAFNDLPLISVVTPTYNTDETMLLECFRSVKSQAYPHWEWCIADDGSTNKTTLKILKTLSDQDERIHVLFSRENGGICQATHQALKMANGEYVAFLDHDDRLSPAALFHVAEAVNQRSGLDVIYSDRDMISTGNLRFMHLMKPEWSPELLFSMNYICHLMVYRKGLVDQVGGVHAAFEGSQDYDLILRIMELSPVVHHIPKVLYHWRQSERSVALDHNVKDYAYKAGVRALIAALDRRGLQGEVSEISRLWRGHYRVKLNRLPSQGQFNHRISCAFESGSYVRNLMDAFELQKTDTYLIFIASTLIENEPDAVDEMLSWFQVDGVGIVTGKIIDGEGHIVHAGMVLRKSGVPLLTYEGTTASEPGYMAVNSVVRNVSVPCPFCFAIRRDLWENLGGLDSAFSGPYAILDLALRAEKAGYRTVFTPFASFETGQDQGGVPSVDWEFERIFFQEKWADWLKNGDPYYNPHLTQSLTDMGLAYRVPSLHISPSP